VKPTKITNLVLIAIAFVVLANLALRATYDRLVTFPTLAGITLFVLAIAEGGLAVALRPRLLGRRDTTPVPPLTAVRVLALAKASSVLGAVMTGAWVGLLVFTLPRQDQVAAAHDTVSSVIGAVSALALAGVALWLEFCCRAPESPEDDHRSGRGSRD
jgi:hypothetical protein